MKNTHKLKVLPLGGMHEIGKNFFVIEYRDDMIIIDCGMTFPEAEQLGIDIVIPDFTYLKENKEKIKGLFITHGHEDHIGAIPYLLKEVSSQIDIYGLPLSLGLLKNKLEEHRLKNTKLHTVAYGDVIKKGRMEVEFIQTTHSIPHASAIAIRTPQGNIIHTGDFKVDLTPIDEGGKIDLTRFAQYGEEGVKLLISDSTNAQLPGYSMSEKVVGETFNNLFSQYRDRRLIIATFASNVHRVQQIITAAEKYKRKVILSGRSMLNVTNTAIELGILKVKKDTIIDIKHKNRYKAHEIVLITTGSQGEPFSALTRMANGDHRQISVNQNDIVILSASMIPGNELAITDVINKLMDRGTEVVYNTLSEIHVSGHANKEELKLMISLVKPEYLMPFHGEAMQMKHHHDLAIDMGIPNENILMIDNGQVVEFDHTGMSLAGTVPAGEILVDGKGVGDVGNIVLRDRKWLSEDGLIIVVLTISKGKVVAGPDLVSRGFVYVRESGDLMEDAQRVVKQTLKKLEQENNMDWNVIKTEINKDLRNYISREIRRKPMILPIIMEV